MSPLLAAFIPGRPRTKGSLRPITPRGQKTRLIEDHPHSKPYRLHLVRQVKPLLSAGPVDGAVGMRLTFQFERIGPTALTSPWPTVNAGVNANGDLDKLVRNVLDAMTGVLFLDDSQVVQFGAGKVWADDRGSGLGIEAWTI